MSIDKWTRIHLVVVGSPLAGRTALARWASWAGGKSRRELNFARERSICESPVHTVARTCSSISNVSQKLPSRCSTSFRWKR